jgi:hypothetical protein
MRIKELEGFLNYCGASIERGLNRSPVVAEVVQAVESCVCRTGGGGGGGWWARLEQAARKTVSTRLAAHETP